MVLSNNLKLYFMVLALKNQKWFEIVIGVKNKKLLLIVSNRSFL